MSSKYQKWIPVILCISVLIISNEALASSGTGVTEWEGPLERIMNSLTGPVARIMSAIIICGAGFAFAQGEQGSTMRKIAGGVIGIVIALNANNIMSLFGSGALII